MAKFSADPIAMRPDKPPSRFGYYLVNSALVMLSPILAVALMVRVLRGKSIQGWSERWGDWQGTDRADVWVHAASVGEVLAVKPIIERYKALRPDDKIVMSVVTPGGHEVAVSTLIGLVREVRYAPFDVPFAIKRIVRVVKPKLFVCVETELWPNLAHLVNRSGARLALVNGRISDRSFHSYRKVKLLTKWILGHFHAVMAQSTADKGRLSELGAHDSRLAGRATRNTTS